MKEIRMLIRSGLISVLLAGVVLSAIPCYLQARGGYSSTLDDGIDELARQIPGATVGDKKARVAILEFQNLSGPNTKFERFVAEELTTRLLKTEKFRGVERTLLNKLIEEQGLSVKDFSNPVYARDLGRRLGADGVVTGTIADMVSTLKINARLISTKTGDILATAATSIIKDRIVLELRGEDIPLEMRIPGSILVKCRLNDVEVYLNDSYVGKTRGGELLIPQALPGRYELRLKKGFMVSKREIELGENQKEKVVVSPGSILINCNVNGAKVYVKNQEVGKIRGGKIELLDILPGEYKIRIKKRYYWDREERVTVLGKANEVTMDLKKMGLITTWGLSFTTIPAEVIPSEEFDRLTGKETDPVSSAQLIRLLGLGGEIEDWLGGLMGFGYLQAGELWGFQGEIDLLAYDLLSLGPWDMYLGSGLFGGWFLGGSNWVGLSDEIPEDAVASDGGFWGWQAFVGTKIFLSSNFALTGEVGYCNYSDLNNRKIKRKVSEDEWEELDYPVEWQYSKVDIGGATTNVGLMIMF